MLYFLIPLTMLSCIAAITSFLSWRAWLKWTDKHLPKTLTPEEFERIAPIVSGPFPRWYHRTDLFRQIIDRDSKSQTDSKLESELDRADQSSS